VMRSLKKSRSWMLLEGSFNDEIGNSSWVHRTLTILWMAGGNKDGLLSDIDLDLILNTPRAQPTISILKEYGFKFPDWSSGDCKQDL
jgi:hypothetical protein